MRLKNPRIATLSEVRITREVEKVVGMSQSKEERMSWL